MSEFGEMSNRHIRKGGRDEREHKRRLKESYEKCSDK